MNVIVITLDGARKDAVISDPRFAKLAKRGTFLSNSFTTAPYTLSSLYALFTGMPGSQNGVDNYYGQPDYDEGNCLTLAQYLQLQGYHCVGDINNRMVLPPHGFDRVGEYDEYTADLFQRHSTLMDVMREESGPAPFFLYLNYSQIHANMIPNVVKKYEHSDPGFFGHQERNFANYCTWADGALSYLEQMIDFMDSRGLLDDSIVFIHSDHGCSVGEKPGELCYGVYLYDYTLSVFQLLLVPREKWRGAEVGGLTLNIDIMPTIMELLGIEQEEFAKPMTGISLLPHIEQGRSCERVSFVSETAPLGGPYPSPEKPNLRALRTKHWKLISNLATGDAELYNLVDDPNELCNLAGTGESAEPELGKLMELAS